MMAVIYIRKDLKKVGKRYQYFAQYQASFSK